MTQANPDKPTFLFSRRASGALPPTQFGTLVGTFDHATLVPEGASRPDDNHVYLWVRVPDGEFAGLYECAFNIHSTDQTNVSFTDWPEDLTGKAPPPAGFTQPALSYSALGLKDADFAPTRQGDLQTLVTHYAETCTRMAAYGTTYSEGTGLHDIHLNSGEQPGSTHETGPGRTGHSSFTPAAPEARRGPPTGSLSSSARRVFKFSTQSLPT